MDGGKSSTYSISDFSVLREDDPPVDVVEEADEIKIMAIEGMVRNAKTVVEHFPDIVGIFCIMRISLFFS